MIDLTPLDVRKKRGDFSKGMRGYDPGEVDSFLELVAERLEALVKENLTLKERSDRLGDQVRSQEGRERAVQEALVTAQELREDILGQARREADLLQREAEARAEAIRRTIDTEAESLTRAAQSEVERIEEDARSHLSDLQESIQELERRRVRFLKSFRSLLERELGDVEVEEMRAPMEVEALEIDLHGARRRQEAEAGERYEPGKAGTPDEQPVAAGEEEAVSTDASEPVIVDVADVAPDAPEGVDAGDTRATEGEEAVEGTWTATLVYDDNQAAPDGDTTARGA